MQFNGWTPPDVPQSVIATPAQPPAPAVPANATPGVLDVYGDKVPTKEWHDDRGHAVHVGGVDVGDTHIHGITGHSKQGVKEAGDLVRGAIVDTMERRPINHPQIDVVAPTT